MWATVYCARSGEGWDTKAAGGECRQMMGWVGTPTASNPMCDGGVSRQARFQQNEHQQTGGWGRTVCNPALSAFTTRAHSCWHHTHTLTNLIFEISHHSRCLPLSPAYTPDVPGLPIFWRIHEKSKSKIAVSSPQVERFDTLLKIWERSLSPWRQPHTLAVSLTASPCRLDHARRARGEGAAPLAHTHTLNMPTPSLPLRAGLAILLACYYFYPETLLGPQFADSGHAFSTNSSTTTRPSSTTRFLEPCLPLLPYIAYELARCCLVHLGAFLLLLGAANAWSILNDASARSVLARSVMNTCFLGTCAWRGYSMWYLFARSSTDNPSPASLFAALSSRDEAAGFIHGFVPSTPHRRLYAHYPHFQRLAAIMAAFQVKNLADTLIYNDGAVFFVHHIITVTTAVLALHPFAHFHGTFFFGISEISTTVLALLANFDRQHGVPRLEAEYPAARLFIGMLFASSFVVIRGILWPIFSYLFIRDCLYVLRTDTAHDRAVVWGFVVMLLTLSCMQAIWLVQIVLTIHGDVIRPLICRRRLKAD